MLVASIGKRLALDLLDAPRGIGGARSPAESQRRQQGTDGSQNIAPADQSFEIEPRSRNRKTHRKTCAIERVHAIGAARCKQPAADVLGSLPLSKQAWSGRCQADGSALQTCREGIRSRADTNCRYSRQAYEALDFPARLLCHDRGNCRRPFYPPRKIR